MEIEEYKEVWINPCTGQDNDEIGIEGGPHIPVLRRINKTESELVQRIERMRKLREGIQKNQALFTNLPDSEVARAEQKIKAIDQQIFQDEVRLANKMQGRGTEATQAYCPVFQDT